MLLIYSKNADEHVKHMELVFSILRKHELYANRKKCNFARSKIEYLGHAISGEGVEVDPKKIKFIADWPKSTTSGKSRDSLD